MKFNNTDKHSDDLNGHRNPPPPAHLLFSPASFLEQQSNLSTTSTEEGEMEKNSTTDKKHHRRTTNSFAYRVRDHGEERVQQARLQTLKSDFEMLQMMEDETIDAFTTKLTTLVNKAASLGHTMEDETLVRKLLNAVPDRYLQIVASIEQYSDLSEMTLEEAIGRLKTYEERIKHKSKQVDNQDRLLFTRYQEQGRMRGHGGFNQSRGQENNFKKETHNNSNKLTHDKSKVMCFKCKEYGHFANRCPLKKEEQSNLTEEDLEPQLLMAIIEESQIRNGRKFHSTST
ncbi:zinc finger, CCHC-type containing protein [Tanacetum coccineum]